MALQAQAQLLDELMGKFRNVAPGDKISSIRYDDEDVCKFYLCGYCPHDLFVNTKADLGPCDKVHDDELRRQYEKASRFGKLGYEEDFERFLRSLLMDVEKKIKRGNERLKLTQQQENAALTPLQAKQEKVASLKEKINTLIKEAESLGEDGKIEEAQQTLESCEKFKSECRYLETQIEQNLHNIEQKQMEVCEVCGSFLIVNDAQARVEEHISGKQHMGYAKVKGTLDEMRVKRLKEYEERDKEREKEKERKRESEKLRRGSEESSSKHSHRDRKRSRSRERNKSRHSRSRSRSRRDKEREDRSKRSSRSKDRERRKSSKNTDSNHRRSKSREKTSSNGASSESKHIKRSLSKSKDDLNTSSSSNLNTNTTDDNIKLETTNTNNNENTINSINN